MVTVSISVGRTKGDGEKMVVGDALFVSVGSAVAVTV